MCQQTRQPPGTRATAVKVDRQITGRAVAKPGDKAVESASAVFRKGGDATLLVEEMRAVFDPKGGYFKAGGVCMPSLVAELGMIVEVHLKSIGMMRHPEMSDAQKALIAEKRKQFEQREGSKKR